VLGVAVSLGASGAIAQPPAAPAKPADVNAPFLDPKLDPESWVEKFEVESREVFAARDAILGAVGLQPGDRIADVGAGTGVFLGPFAAAVGPTGRVYAVDISPRLVEFVERRIDEEKLANVAVVLSTEDSTKLAAGCVSHVFVCDAYHHFGKYPEMLASIRQALVPGGEFVVVDFERIPGVTREWLLDHVRADKETVREEIEAAGFEFLGEVEVPAFKENYLLRFRRPAKSG
jgi:ubiquinone/menaquinone biosynthesis C-methylase UbiE